MMYQRAMENLLLRESDSRVRTSVSKNESTARKKMARIVVITTTITPVITVSRRVGQTTFLVSVLTWLMNSMGVVFATRAVPAPALK